MQHLQKVTELLNAIHCSHDHAAELMGVAISSFQEDAKPEISALLTAYDAYLKKLLALRDNK